MGFADFIRERQLLSNVSPSTLEWYKYSFKWLRHRVPIARRVERRRAANARKRAESDGLQFGNQGD